MLIAVSTIFAATAIAAAVVAKRDHLRLQSLDRAQHAKTPMPERIERRPGDR